MNRSQLGSNARRFNRACAAFALLFILAAQLVRPATSYQDFSQYYMGALMARAGLWDAIYPEPLPDGIYNAGWMDQSHVRDAYKGMGERHGINEFGFRFIQSPPVALLFIPLTLLEHPTAYKVWITILSLCMWGIALQAARIYTIARGRREDAGAGVIMMVIACSVLAYRAVRVGNVSPVVGLCVGAIVLDLLRPRASSGSSVVAGLAMTVGALAKYATPVLAPIHAVMNRWAALLWSAAFVLAIVAGTWALSGTARSGNSPLRSRQRSAARTRTGRTSRSRGCCCARRATRRSRRGGRSRCARRRSSCSRCSCACRDETAHSRGTRRSPVPPPQDSYPGC